MRNLGGCSCISPATDSGCLYLFCPSNKQLEILRLGHAIGLVKAVKGPQTRLLDFSTGRQISVRVSRSTGGYIITSWSKLQVESKTATQRLARVIEPDRATKLPQDNLNTCYHSPGQKRQVFSLLSPSNCTQNCGNCRAPGQEIQDYPTISTASSGLKGL